MRQFVIDGVTVAEDTRAYVIAEASHNGGGDIEKGDGLIHLPRPQPHGCGIVDQEGYVKKNLVQTRAFR